MMSGSLSQLIVCESVQTTLDDAFKKAKEGNKWDEYFDDCQCYLMKAAQENAPLSFNGALVILQYFFDEVIKSSDNEITLYKAVKMLEKVTSLCSGHPGGETMSWNRTVAESGLLKAFYAEALLHSNAEVRLFVMKQIKALLKDVEVDVILSLSDTLLVNVVSVLATGVEQDASLAKSFLVSVSQSPKGLEILFSDSKTQDAFTTASKNSDTAKFNVFEVMQRIAMLGPDQLSLVSNSGWLDELVDVISSDDSLAKMASLQILTDLLQDDRALQHMTRAGVLMRLQDTLVNLQSGDDPMAAVILPGLLKVFGVLGNNKPEMLCRDHSAALNTIFHLILNSSDPSLPINAFDTLAHIATTSTAKKLLVRYYDDHMKSVLTSLKERLRSAPMEARSRYLAALVQLLQCSDDDSFDRQEEDETCDLLRGWYSAVFPNLQSVEAILRLPFSDLHLLAYRLLLAVVQWSWGASLVASSKRVLEYLINRSTETSKEGKELKYDLVKKLLEKSSDIKEDCGDQMLEKLREFYKQGPFYVQPFNDEIELDGIRR